MNPRILLVDDDPDVLDSYEDLLRHGGYTFGRARARDEALRLLDAEGPWDVVLLDERLEGPGGGASGAALVGEISARFPDARVLVVTGFPRKELVRDALAAGAWDYLQKDEFLALLLPQKVRQAADLALTRRIAHASGADRERALRTTWAAARTERDRNRKGALLEQTMRLLFETLPGLEHVRTNWRSEVEELDLVVRNESADPILSKEGSFWLVECKNWSGKVDPEVVRNLVGKLRERRGRAPLGFLVAVNGFTRAVDVVAERHDELILFLDGDALTAWIDTPDRVGWLKTRLEAAVLRG